MMRSSRCEGSGVGRYETTCLLFRNELVSMTNSSGLKYLHSPLLYLVNWHKIILEVCGPKNIFREVAAERILGSEVQILD